MTVIGVSWQGVPSGQTELTRVGVTQNNAQYYGPASGGAAFDNFGVWGQIERINVGDDGKGNSSHGTYCYTDTETDTMGQVMVKIPAFVWYYYTGFFFLGSLSDIGTKIYLYTYNGQPVYHTLSWSDIHPAFVVGGGYSGGMYVSAFEGFLNPDSLLLESKAGVTPSMIETHTLARTYAESRGTGWELMTIRAADALKCLFVMEYASINSQAALGNGISSDSAVHDTGETGTPGTDRGNHSYGTTGNTTTAMSYRGVENLWGNQECLIEGLNVNWWNNAYYLAYIAPQSRTRPRYYQWDTFASPYVFSTSLVDGGDEGTFMKTAPGPWLSGYGGGGGSATTFYCDKTWMDSAGTKANRVMAAGGTHGDGTGAGIFAQRYYVTDAAPTGARLMYIGP